MEVVNEIKMYLNSNGYVGEDTVFERYDKINVGTVVINGVQQYQTKEVSTRFEYIGDGWIDDETHPIYGYNVRVNGQDAGDAWVDSLEDFKTWFPI